METKKLVQGQTVMETGRLHSHLGLFSRTMRVTTWCRDAPGPRNKWARLLVDVCLSPGVGGGGLDLTTTVDDQTLA